MYVLEAHALIVLLLMQPVIWFALGIIALVKFSLGKLCLL